MNSASHKSGSQRHRPITAEARPPDRQVEEIVQPVIQPSIRQDFEPLDFDIPA